MFSPSVLLFLQMCILHPRFYDIFSEQGCYYVASTCNVELNQAHRPKHIDEEKRISSSPRKFIFLTRLPFHLLNVESEIGDAQPIIYLISERRIDNFFKYEDQTNLILCKYLVMPVCWLVSNTWLLFLQLLLLPGSWRYASAPNETNRIF